MRPSPEVVAAATLEFQRRFGNRAVTSQSVREQHAHTTTWIPNQPPDVVVFAESEEDVRDAVKIAAAHHLPIVPFGTGSSLEGHVNAPFGGVSIDMQGMKKILAVHPEDLDCVVEPGVTRKQLNEYLKSHGLFFPIDPGADASIGGMVATRASGTNAVRYGTMKDNVLALEAILPNGEKLVTARRAKKTSAGYDLTRLLVGSEGTLGIVTKITLKLSGLPEAVSAGVCPFPDIESAANATILTIQSGLPVARIELLDEVQIRACNQYSKLNLAEQPTLFVEFHGTEQGVAEQAQRFGEIAADLGGGPFSWATKPEDRTKLWEARHNAYWASLTLRPGAKGISTDVCVPISRLAECIAETKADLESAGLISPIVGHVGDGNFHCLPLIDMSNEAEIAAAKGFMARLVERALAMEGTCTGEHGVGQGKMKYLETELGAPALDAMRLIKQALDPKNLMNPGKIVMIGS
ncbi:MAG: FAD-binding protein [Methylobacterium sp.]|nr:FAD-binding protein [Methylobacterium sp.]MCA3599553.1 FAD-binding protein [Methylobacterium sp.]MCA3606856.1 FAD-binding protein [Methylobacterium sp.]MCA3608467.1 FAD-binding protein [Methylobacterium sp.]MCA3613250.1 FAD-binding protein [Methylobacterium sp.]